MRRCWRETIGLAERPAGACRRSPASASSTPPSSARGQFDLTKLVIDVHGLGITGFAAEQALRERFGSGPEMSDLVGVVCLVTSATPAADRPAGRRLRHARRRAPPRPPRTVPRARSSGAVIGAGTGALAREAFFAPSRAVPLAAAAGEVAAELVIPYPPGIPVLAPGDVISADKLAYLEHGRGPTASTSAAPPTPLWRPSGWSPASDRSCHGPARPRP